MAGLRPIGTGKTSLGTTDSLPTLAAEARPAFAGGLGTLCLDPMGETQDPMLDAGEAAAILRWLRSAGVDVALQETPRDRFAETAHEAEKRRAHKPAQPAAPSALGASSAPLARHPAASAAPIPAPIAVSLLPPDAMAAEAYALASKAETLDALRAALESFGGCGLKETATSLVFGDGDATSGLMVIGEAPGREEDIAGHPFVGRSGQLLDRMLAAIGLPRQTVRVANTVPWRPPGNRSPTPMETEICRPFLMRQIELVAPRIVLAVGSSSVKTLTGSEEGILRSRGRWSTLELPNGQMVPMTATLHPAYLLRQPAQKKLAWRDLLAVQQRLPAADTPAVEAEKSYS